MVPRSVRVHKGRFAAIGPLRTRAVIYQLSLAAVFLLAAWYLASTAARNLLELGVATGFGFLSRESGFAIGETTFLAYSPADTYLKALLVGILNTLRVATIAVLFSTLAGALIGLARLSTHWLLAKIAAGYVEILRNVPLVVQLFFWYALFTEYLPGPADAWNPAPGVFISNRGVAFPAPSGASGAWPVAITAGILAALLVLVFRKNAAATARQRRARLVAVGGLVVAGLSIAVASLPLKLEYPEFSGFNFTGGGSLSPEFTALLLGLSLYTAAFIAEIVRAGFLAVDRGQIEAGASLGLSRLQITRFIVVPQALRVIVPPVTSQYLNCTKNSSLAIAIGYPDLVSIANTTINQTGQAIEGFMVIILVYLTISLAISFFMNWYNRRIARRGSVA